MALRGAGQTFRSVFRLCPALSNGVGANTASTSSNSCSPWGCWRTYAAHDPQKGSPDAPAPAEKSSIEYKDEEWTEVVDQGTGQTYYWNQSTGETTDLGEPKPKTRFRDQRYTGSSAADSGPFQEGWREPPGENHTIFYSFVGVVIGVSAGWATQYMH